MSAISYAPARRATKACCYVYLVSGGDKLTKVGMSDDPKKRLDSLRTANAEKMALEHSWRVQTRDQAAALEARLHGLFRWGRVRREWFAIEPNWIRGVADHLLAGREAIADQIAACLQEAHEHMQRHDTAHSRWKILNVRWHKDEREDLRRTFDAALVDHATAYRSALAAGLPAAEWDHVLYGED